MIWGVLIAIACMALFVFLIKGWYKDAKFSPISYVVGFVLFLFLSFQCVLIVGSLKIISISDLYEGRIASLVEGYSPEEEISQTQASHMIDTIIREFPILTYYIGGVTTSGYTASEFPSVMAHELRSFMCWYIFRRVLWCMFFVIIASIMVIKSLNKNYSGLKRRRPQYVRQRVSRKPRR